MSVADRITMMDLPSELFIDIIGRWLNLESLVKLDAAVCSHKTRLTLLDAFSSSHCVFTSSVRLEDKSAVQWFRSRKLQVSNLSISAYSPELAKYLRLHFASIRHLTCLGAEAVGIANTYIRNLTTLTFRNIEAVPQLNDVLWLNSNLQELQLKDVSDLSTEHFDGLKLPLLQLLSLRGSACDDALLGMIVRTTAVLRKIDIGKCDSVTDVGVIVLAQRCPFLCSLGLSFLPISDGALMQLTQLCPDIASLDLFGNKVVTDLGVLAIARNLKKLRHISITDCDSLTDVSIEHLTRCNATTLQVLDASGLPAVRVVVLQTLLTKCPNLHTLYLDCDLDAYHADIVPHMCNLRTLVIYALLSDSALCLIATHCKQLHKLGIYSIYKYVEPTTTDETEVPFSEATADTRIMHNTTKMAEYEEHTYTEKGLLALMDGLPHLQVLAVRGEELDQGQLPPFAQSVWRRLRPHIVFVDDPDYFDFNPLLE